MSEVNAWLLDLGDGLLAAVGELELVHMLPDAPTLFDVPRSPAYCSKVLVWQQTILPVMNLAMRLTGRPVTADRGLIGITAFQEHSGTQTHYGALLLSKPPARIRVSDSLACELPAAPPDWRPITIACFEHPGHGPVPVLNLQTLFSPRHFITEPISTEPRMNANEHG